MADPNGMFRSRYHELNLIHFMTAGQQEVRCWTVFNGAVAPQVCRWLMKPDRTARALLAIQTMDTQ
jgi:ribosome-binding ATPase YchF (GTP1/OBG family)